uniref:dynein regulatory complex protein 10 isoform X1 n=1 Tax=Myxine glutinosa TaxID=7769 RepID=UPI00358E95CF
MTSRSFPGPTGRARGHGINAEDDRVDRGTMSKGSRLVQPDVSYCGDIKEFQSLEVKRIMAVMDGMLDRVRLALHLPAMSQELEPGISQALEEYKHLEETWSKGEIGSEVNVELVRSSFRSLLRQLRGYMGSRSKINMESRPTDAGMMELLTALEALRDLTLERLLTPPQQEELDKNTLIQQVQPANQHTIAAIRETLESKLQVTQREKEEQIFNLNAEEQQLEAELLTTKHMAKEELHQQIINVDEQCEGEAQASKAKQELLQEEVEEQRNQHRTLMAEHHESEFAMRKKVYRMEKEVENWIEKYDSEMDEKQEELEVEQSGSALEQAELAELEKRFKRLEREYMQVQAELQPIREQRLLEEAELERWILATTTIQATWRGFCVRKMLKSLKKQKVKKGGKSKGKGKKK